MSGLDRFVAAVSRAPEPRRAAAVGTVVGTSADSDRVAVDVRFPDMDDTVTAVSSVEVAAHGTPGMLVLVVFSTPPVAVSVLGVPPVEVEET